MADKPSGILTGLLSGCLLIVSGIAVCWWSSDLMIWLIHLVGEEQALGAGNVSHTPDGRALLTNPVGMMRWTLPFWMLGAVQIIAGGALIWSWQRRRSLNKDFRSEGAMTIRHCCDHMKWLIESPNEHGFSIGVTTAPKFFGSRLVFVLEARPVSQTDLRAAKLPNDLPVLTGIKACIKFCPWCGRRLEQHYDRYRQQLPLDPDVMRDFGMSAAKDCGTPQRGSGDSMSQELK